MLTRRGVGSDGARRRSSGAAEADSPMHLRARVARSARMDTGVRLRGEARVSWCKAARLLGRLGGDASVCNICLCFLLEIGVRGGAVF